MLIASLTGDDGVVCALRGGVPTIGNLRRLIQSKHLFKYITANRQSSV